MKRIMRIIAVLLLAVLTLTACSGDGKKKPDGWDDSKINLVYRTWGSPAERAVVQSIIDGFHLENDDVNVILQVATGDYFGDLKLALAGGGGPDIFNMHPGEVYEFVQEDFLLAYDDYLSPTQQAGKLSASDLWSINDGFKYNGNTKEMGSGKIYSIIKDWSPDFFLYYNKNHVDLYNAKADAERPAGLKIADLPAAIKDGDKLRGGSTTQALSLIDPLTFSEYIMYAKCLGYASGKPGNMLDNDPYRMLQYWVELNGGSMFSDDNSSFIADQAMERSFQSLIDMQSGGYLCDFNTGTEAGKSTELFSIGNVSTVFYGRWAYTTYGWGSKNIGYAPPPVPDDYATDARNNTTGETGSDGIKDISATAIYIGLSINRESSNRDAAYRFVEYYMTKGLETIATQGNNIPGNKTVAKQVFANPDCYEGGKTNKEYLINQYFYDCGLNFSTPQIFNPKMSQSKLDRIIGQKLTKYFAANPPPSLSEFLLELKAMVDNELSY